MYAFIYNMNILTIFSINTNPGNESAGEGLQSSIFHSGYSKPMFNTRFGWSLYLENVLEIFPRLLMQNLE